MGIPTYALKNLFLTLQGDPALDSPRSLSTLAEKELSQIEQIMQTAYLDRIDPDQPVVLIVFPSQHSPTEIFWQEDRILEWLFLPNKEQK